ncbi:hypothetical protein [Bryobacter aggregatus]|uniref:hypothetical protein n=1 Tax=Bryobacter aggregatus TaxID=360054 RepID=UPI00068F97C2|nr:hypothetical protein [Bryobacter aggregatus]
MTATHAGNSVTSLIESARRRLHLQILSTQALVALSIGAGGLVLLLILGTQVLNWYWPLLLGGLSFGVLAWRVWNQLPNSYRSAQIVDQRLQTADLFSSAHYFLSQADTPQTQELIATADAAAASVSASAAVPFRMPSGWARASAISAVALSLLVFRYAFQSSLDLEQPIAPGLFQLLASGEKPTALAKGNRKDPNAPPLEGFGMTETAQQRSDEKRAEASQDLESQTPNSNESAASGQKPGQFQQAMSPSEDGEKMQGAEKGEKGDSGAAGEKGDQAGKDGEKKDAASQDKKSGGKEQQGNPQGDKSSLMDKFKDAMANMMNKMKSEDKGQQGKQDQQKGQQDQQQGNGQQQQAQKGQQQQQQGKQQSGQQQADPNGQQQGEGSEKSQQQQAKGGDQSNQPSSADAKAGMGKQDGAKNIELAEQEKAMGKISEVFGKRAQNLQGEIMIEVSSSKSQSLKTSYSGKNAGHSDTSGVIQRDEVPLIFQNYVQRYFEELRKSPAPTAPPAK